ncbi:hypothetical protein L873DRAFT_1681808 [Choiromyces venosus 120613-1]|uniref:Iron-sulfur assembly protein 1 n=1 Tax=Choiromyces venosus 120613-1 TaxID=1336337 RepID=A0A3N4JP62_9PEZI|nr:hypothetical protein L873DRAFT_1681808 [Choiromyces venosus 120613-1]
MSLLKLPTRRLLSPRPGITTITPRLSRTYTSNTSNKPPSKRQLQTSTSTTTPPPPPPLQAIPPSTTKTKTPLRRPRKSAITLTPSAIQHLRALLAQPTPQLIRIGVKNRGCSGLAYHLEYVDRPGTFDEEVVQDGVRVLIDSKALFSIIGSEMDWVEDRVSARFVFRNPNIKEQCGCGESFSVG